MEIYTRTGDAGMTMLASGENVSKSSDRVEAYGNVDNLNSWIGRIVAELPEKYSDIAKELVGIQQKLFDCQTDLANPKLNEKSWRVDEQDATQLEKIIDHYTSLALPLTHFVLPGGSIYAADSHVARTFTRNAERRIVNLRLTADINPFVLSYINRLSDYFFSLAREFNRREGIVDVYYESNK